MTLDEYLNSTDSNDFWRLSSGEHQNLLDEAIERIEALKVQRGESGQLDTHVMPDWNLVKDTLPEREGQYLIYDKDGSVLSAYFEGTKFTKGGAGGFWVVAVIGWMNLPKPPRA